MWWHDNKKLFYIYKNFFLCLPGIESKLEALLSDLTSVKGGEGEVFTEIKSSIQDKNEAVEKEVGQQQMQLPQPQQQQQQDVPEQEKQQ